ncbi:zinc finger BED domain-containing protein RICESLEEPER 2-like protein isoform X1 [Tanacetum coccineum]|uniref:Zinc finger BED domain-containing protein RICESLEEPER 2-like protein isoform X1 n=1 Tax=Tanacetum coccineum TaxID=301880 RepID=A0ABQ4XQF2_9ASTR
MPNVPLSEEIGAGGRPRCQEAMGGVIAQTRSERTSKHSYDSPLPRVNTPESDEERIKHQDLMDFVPPTPHDSPLSGGHTPGSDEETKRVKKLERKAKSSIPPPKRILYKHIASSNDSLGEENVSKLGMKSDKTKPMFDDSDAEKGGSTAEQITTARDTVNTASIDFNVARYSNVSVAGPSTSTAGDIFEYEMMTIADTLVAIRSTRPRTTSVIIHDVEEEPRREQRIARERAAEQEAKDAALIEQMEDIQARMDADELLVARLQEKEREQFSINEQARFLVETIAERKWFFYTHNQLKSKSFEEIQKLYEKEQKWINDFVPMDSEEGGKKTKSSKKEAASSKRRQRADPDDENVKRQKLEDTAKKEGLKAYLNIDPDEDRAVNYETLATKYPIVDWESQIIGSDLQGNDLSYWKITRADGSSKLYKVFSMMLEDFNRQDLVDLHRLVKERSASRALKGYDLILWGDLKTMSKPDMESSLVEGSSSQGLGQNSTASPFTATGTPNDNPILEDNEINRTTNNNGTMEEEEEESSHFESKKRKTTSKVWNEFTKITLPDGRQKAECHHCKSKLSILASGSTTHLGMHLKSFTPRAIFQKKQQRITLQVVDPDSMSQVVTPALVDIRFDMMKMRESMAHWILMHEHPFTIVEEEGFNMMQQRGMLQWERTSRASIKNDWHFVDSNWKLQKHVLSFIHLPPPHRGTDIADNFYKCFKDWNIENKVLTISVDNASNNDKAIKNLTETFSRIKKLPCGGSEYPTSNLFLNEVHRIKVLLDKLFFDHSQDKFVHDLVKSMKENFDKYWKECNLLMSVAAVLDPRCKMTVAKFTFPRMYSGDELKANIKTVEDALSELYEEYVSEYYSSGEQSGETSVGLTSINITIQASSSGWSEFNEFVKKNGSVKPQKSELDNYLEEGVYICNDNSKGFDVLTWWRANSLRYRILSQMAQDILAIPIIIVASKATFSSGSRVIDTYRASLAPKTVEVLLCGGDWCRSLHGLKRKNKKEKMPIEVILPIT